MMRLGNRRDIPVRARLASVKARSPQRLGISERALFPLNDRFPPSIYAPPRKILAIRAPAEISFQTNITIRNSWRRCASEKCSALRIIMLEILGQHHAFSPSGIPTESLLPQKVDFTLTSILRFPYCSPRKSIAALASGNVWLGLLAEGGPL